MIVSKKLKILVIILGSLLLSSFLTPLSAYASENVGFKIQYNWINEKTGDNVLPPKNDFFELGTKIKTRGLGVEGFSIDISKSTIKQVDPIGFFVTLSYKETIDRMGCSTMDEAFKKSFDGVIVEPYYKDSSCILTTYLIPNK